MLEQPAVSEASEPTAISEPTTLPQDTQSAVAGGASLTCSKCGIEIPAAARFCAACGNVIDSDVIAAKVKNKKMKIIAAAVVLVLLLGASAGGVVMVRRGQAAKAAADVAAAKKAEEKAAAEKAAAKHAEQAEELRNVFNEVAAIDSAVSVGTNQRDYASKVQDARAALDTYDSPDEQAQIVVNYLEDAMWWYSTVSTYWNGTIVDRYLSLDEAMLSDSWSTAGDILDEARTRLDTYEDGGVTL